MLVWASHFFVISTLFLNLEDRTMCHRSQHIIAQSMIVDSRWVFFAL